MGNVNDITQYLDLGHWKWCRQRLIGRSSNCPCNNIPVDMPFIDLDWLLKSDLRNLPRMQELPKVAFIFPTEMDYAYFISHRWLNSNHPDITGSQLAIALPKIWSDRGYLKNKNEDRQLKKTGVWYDFLCMPQSPKSSSDEILFQDLLLKHSFLTVITIPVLVLDNGMEYATRAWCVAENIGRLISGLKGKSASLAMLMLDYGENFSNNFSAWDQEIHIKDGFRPGLQKFKEWYDENSFLINSSNINVERDWQKHKECLNKVNEVCFTFNIAVLKDYDLTDDNLLNSIARRHSLKCSIESDLIICMRIMSSILRVFAP